MDIIHSLEVCIIKINQDVNYIVNSGQLLRLKG
jgi:hypothetical protein